MTHILCRCLFTSQGRLGLFTFWDLMGPFVNFEPLCISLESSLSSDAYSFTPTLNPFILFNTC